MTKLNIAAPAHWVLEKTYFKHFVAGTNLGESLQTAAELSHHGLSTILDYSIESADGNIDEVVDVLVDVIRQSAQRRYTPFCCFKITALASHHLLMRMNEILEYGKANPSYAGATELLEMAQAANFEEFVQSLILKKSQTHNGPLVNGTPELPKPWATGPLGGVPPALTVKELQTMLLPFARRLERLGQAAHEANQPLLIDAEQSWFQETIHFASRSLMRRYNKSAPLIYNTYQMYLKAAPSELAADIEYARQNNLILGAKVVRGAYMDAEAAWAKEHGLDNPNWHTIDATHSAYNAAVSTMLDLAKTNAGAVVIASHNEKSMLLGSKGLADRNMAPNHPYVHFGQLYGMCDHMSLALAHNGHNIVKYVPFGPVAEVIPYLMRRVSENRGFLASTKKEQGLMLTELKARIFGTPKTQPQL
jgi:proline dehydrogenase